MEGLDDFRTVAERIPSARLGEILALLESAGLSPEVVDRGRNRADVRVAVEAFETATALIAEEYPSGFPSQPEPVPPRRPAAPLLAGPGLPAVLAIVVVCSVVMWSTHFSGAEPTRAHLLRQGAISDDLIARGEYWRWLTAVFFHFDAAHFLSNMATLLLIAPPLANLVGARRFLWIFVATGVLANVASHVIAPTGGLKGGASGGVAGVLGALAGLQLGRAEPRDSRAAPSWQVLGALGAVYALLVGAGPGRDNVAHLAGLLSGIALGMRTEWRPRRDPGRPPR